jgi:hypothetical protein
MRVSRLATASSGDLLSRNPITGSAACCARAASGHAAALPSSVMNCRRFIRSPRRRARPVWVECCKGNNLVASTIEKQIAPNEKHPCLLSDCGFKGHN